MQYKTFSKHKSEDRLLVYLDKNNKVVKEKFITKVDLDKRIAVLKKNEGKRQMNGILKDITGTSARAAREDMGL